MRRRLNERPAFSQGSAGKARRVSIESLSGSCGAMSRSVVASGCGLQNEVMRAWSSGRGVVMSKAEPTVRQLIAGHCGMRAKNVHPGKPGSVAGRG